MKLRMEVPILLALEVNPRMHTTSFSSLPMMVPSQQRNAIEAYILHSEAIVGDHTRTFLPRSAGPAVCHRVGWIWAFGQTYRVSGGEPWCLDNCDSQRLSKDRYKQTGTHMHPLLLFSLN